MIDQTIIEKLKTANKLIAEVDDVIEDNVQLTEDERKQIDDILYDIDRNVYDMQTFKFNS